MRPPRSSTPTAESQTDAPPARVDVVVLGAGISGLAAAKMVIDGRPGASVLVLEEADWLGGTQRSFAFGGHSFDVGSIVFHDTDAQFRLFPGLYETCVPVGRADVAKVCYGGGIGRYPLDWRRDLLSAGAGHAARVAAEVLAWRLRRRRAANAAEFARGVVGPTFFVTSGLRDYMEKFNRAAAEEIDVEFAERRMGDVVKGSRVLKNILSRAGRRIGVVSSPTEMKTVVRPHEGFDKYYGTIAGVLRDRGVVIRSGVTLKQIRGPGAGRPGVVVTREGEVTCDRIISTIPPGRVGPLTGLPPAPTDHVGLLTLFVTHDGPRHFESPVLYNFAPRATWKRLTVHSDFYGRVDGKEAFGVEVTFAGEPPEAEATFREFANHVSAEGVMTGRCELLGSYLTPAAYPRLTVGTPGRMAAYLDEVRARGIETVGKQGAFRYLPITDTAIKDVRGDLGVAAWPGIDAIGPKAGQSSAAPAPPGVRPVR